MDQRVLVMSLSVAVSLLMLAGKLTAFALTGSAAVMADAAESVVHLAATSFAAFGLWYANQPADENHPYGHGRIAFLSAGFEGALIFAAAFAVISSGVYDLWRGPSVERAGLGLLISSGLAGINLLLGAALVRVGKSKNSFVLIANGKHVLTDVLTTAAAIVGLALVAVTDWQLFDPLIAILIGGVIMFSGIKIIRSSVAGLMDELPPELRQRLDQSLRAAINDGVIQQFHDVRARRIDDELWLEMHLLVPGATPVTVAHRAATLVEKKLRADFPEYRVHANSHVEPLDHDRAHATAILRE